MRTEAAPGSDPAPATPGRAAEDEPAAWGDAPQDAGRDADLRRDKPPHWA